MRNVGSSSVASCDGRSACGRCGSTAGGFAEQDEKRRALNDFIRNSGVFDAVVEFDQAVLDTSTGQLKPQFVPESTTGGPGDKLHPNRAGYVAMAGAIDPAVLPALARR